MPDYAKMKNAELEALLKQRSLPHTGKKADMVARLQEDDKKESATAPAAAAKEDEIDWDDDAAESGKAAAPAPSTTKSSTGAPSIATSTAPKTATAPTASTDVTKSAVPPTSGTGKPVGSDAATAASNQPEEGSESKPATDFSIGLPETTLDEEIEKRKARAKKFGLQEDNPLADEALQRLARAKKFGETDRPMGLNSALPERREKRRRDGEDHGRHDFKRRGRGGRRHMGRGDGDRRQDQGNGTWMSEKDRAAAEARKARFATTT
jgi:SAP domain-containing ribonucleoprotein